jgi:hypothetical protein
VTADVSVGDIEIDDEKRIYKFNDFKLKKFKDLHFIPRSLRQELMTIKQVARKRKVRFFILQK